MSISGGTVNNEITCAAMSIRGSSVNNEITCAAIHVY